MAFTVQEFHDLVQLLYERADWRAELRRIYGSVTPVAAGEGVTPNAREQADDLGVQLVLDGRALGEADE